MRVVVVERVGEHTIRERRPRRRYAFREADDARLLGTALLRHKAQRRRARRQTKRGKLETDDIDDALARAAAHLGWGAVLSNLRRECRERAGDADTFGHAAPTIARGRTGE